MNLGLVFIKCSMSWVVDTSTYMMVERLVNLMLPDLLGLVDIPWRLLRLVVVVSNRSMVNLVVFPGEPFLFPSCKSKQQKEQSVREFIIEFYYTFFIVFLYNNTFIFYSTIIIVFNILLFMYRRSRWRKFMIRKLQSTFMPS